TKSNYTSTEQVLRALISLKEYKTPGKYDFYSSDINAKELPVFGVASNVYTKVIPVLVILFMAIGIFYFKKNKSKK
ncbi:MAG: hypothetical protein N2B06_05745, partial [Clostridium sp.]